MQNVKGTTTTDSNAWDALFSGPFYGGAYIGGASARGGSSGGKYVHFDLSRAARTADETRPVNVAFQFIVIAR